MRDLRISRIEFVEPLRLTLRPPDDSASKRSSREYRSLFEKIPPQPHATNPANAYGNTAVMFRFGTSPTGMRIVSFIVLMSTTDTEFDAAFAT